MGLVSHSGESRGVLWGYVVVASQPIKLAAELPGGGSAEAAEKFGI